MSDRLNEKSARNKIIYLKKINGTPVCDLAQEYGVSLPRIHRICLKEENKALHVENERLKREIEKLKNEKK